MQEEFVPYEQALALKELGFNEPCLMYYDYSWTLVESGVYECKTPLYQQVFRWFREKYNLDYSIQPFYYNESAKIRFRWDCYKFIYHPVPNKRDFELFGDAEATREEAELECLKKLIELCKKN